MIVSIDVHYEIKELLKSLATKYEVTDNLSNILTSSIMGEYNKRLNNLTDYKDFKELAKEIKFKYKGLFNESL